MTRALALPALAVLALAACDPMPPAPPAAEPPPATDACGASGLQGFVGQDESVVYATTFTNPIRVYGPDDAITMDYSPERINFETDASGTIVRVSCG